MDNKSRILITGGTGSFGKAFVSNILKKFPDIKRLVISPVTNISNLR